MDGVDLMANLNAEQWVARDKTAYNALVQNMQEFCLAAGLENRVSAHRGDDGRLSQAQFEVYYGEWHILGIEFRPMQPDTSRIYMVDNDARIRASVARDLSM